MQRSNEKIHLDILRFLDSRSLQKARFASRQLNSLIQKELSDVAVSHLEIVQIRWQNEGGLICRCLPSIGPAHQYKPVSMLDAVAWLRPLVRNCFIRLFNLQNLELDGEALNALERIPECRLVQLSLVGVSLANTNAQKLCDLMQVQLRANRYYFGRIRNASSDKFFDGMLRSNAFLAMEKIQIDVASYSNCEYLGFTDDAIIEWYFKANPILGYAVMIMRDVDLREDFVEKLLKKFQQQTQPKSISLVLCGQCRQITTNFEQYISIRNEVSTCALANLQTGEELEVEVMDKSRLEIARRTLKKNIQIGAKPNQKQLGAYRKLSAKENHLQLTQ